MINSVLIGSILLGVVSTSALAQHSLGELLDTGGKKLSKAELVAALAGSTVSGQNKNGDNFEITFKADGTYTGSAERPQGYTDKN